ncbi:MAG: T9SS type A sorting domain-containing protein, partial [Crocinitomicaceae bacterium]
TYVQTSATGRLQRDVAGSARLFPVGRGSYNPATLTNAGTSDKYSIRVIDRLTNIGVNAESDNQSDSAVVKRTWMIDENVIGGSNVTLRLDWNAESEHQNIRFDPFQPYIAHYNSTDSKWENKGSTSTAYSAGLSGFVQTTGITSFSPFGISSPEGGVALPVEFLYFNTNCEDDKTYLTWATASEHNNMYFAILASENGMDWVNKGLVHGAGYSNEKIDYTFILEDRNTYSYVKLDQVDMDGTTTTYGPFDISCDNTQEVTIYPNPFVDHVILSLTSSKNDQVDLSIYSLGGQVVATEKLEVNKGNNKLFINTSELSSGAYILTLQQNGRKTQFKCFKP